MGNDQGKVVNFGENVKMMVWLPVFAIAVAGGISIESIKKEKGNDTLTERETKLNITIVGTKKALRRAKKIAKAVIKLPKLHKIYSGILNHDDYRIEIKERDPTKGEEYYHSEKYLSDSSKQLTETGKVYRRYGALEISEEFYNLADKIYQTDYNESCQEENFRDLNRLTVLKRKNLLCKKCHTTSPRNFRVQNAFKLEYKCQNCQNVWAIAFKINTMGVEELEDLIYIVNQDSDKSGVDQCLLFAKNEVENIQPVDDIIRDNYMRSKPNALTLLRRTNALSLLFQIMNKNKVHITRDVIEDFSMVQKWMKEINPKHLASKKLSDDQIKFLQSERISIPDAIQLSSELKGEGIVWRLIQWRESGGGDKNKTYVRIGMGFQNLDNIGHRIIIEIWPPHHESPRHNHGDSYGVIWMLKGQIEQFKYTDLKTAEPPIDDGPMIRNEVEVITKHYNQTHVVNNKENQLAVSLHSYSGDFQHEFAFFDEAKSTVSRSNPPCHYAAYLTGVVYPVDDADTPAPVVESRKKDPDPNKNYTEQYKINEFFFIEVLHDAYVRLQQRKQEKK